MKKARFEALIEGHKGVSAILIPFDPEAVWRLKPIRLAGRRHGWLVKGTANGVRFNSYIGDRWGRFFITLDDSLREAAGIALGDMVSMIIEPTSTAEAYLQARQQSERTTQPSRARADALAFSDGVATKLTRSRRKRGRLSSSPRRRGPRAG